MSDGNGSLSPSPSPSPSKVNTHDDGRVKTLSPRSSDRKSLSPRPSPAVTPSPRRQPSIHPVASAHSASPLPTLRREDNADGTRSSYSPSRQGLPSPPATNSDTTGSIGKTSTGGVDVNAPGSSLGMTDLQRVANGGSSSNRQLSRVVEQEAYHSPLRRTSSLPRSPASPESSRSSPHRSPGDWRSDDATQLQDSADIVPNGQSSNAAETAKVAEPIVNKLVRSNSRTLSARYGEITRTPTRSPIPYPRAASATSSSHSGSFVRERVENIEAKHRVESTGRAVSSSSVTSGSKSKHEEQNTIQTTPKKTGDVNKRWSGLSPSSSREHNLASSNDMIASPSRSSATVTRTNVDENDDTLVLSKLNRVIDHTRGVQGSNMVDNALTDLIAWRDEDEMSEEMDAEEKVDMWRGGTGYQPEGDSGGSGTSRRRSALPMEFRSDLALSTDHSRRFNEAYPQAPSPVRTPQYSNRHHVEAMVALEASKTGLTRSASLRSPGRLGLPRDRFDGDRVRAERSHLTTLRLSSGSVSGLRTFGGVSQTESDRWETGTTRTRHSSLMPSSRTLQDLSEAGLAAVEADRAESRMRRAALLSSMDGTPERGHDASLRQRGNSSEPRMGSLAGIRLRPSTSLSSHLSSRVAPTSAPANASTDRHQTYASLRESQSSDHASRLPDSPLDKYRPSTRMSHRMSTSQSEIGSVFPKPDNRQTARIPARSEASYSSAGTPSRVIMARLLASMRSASSHQSRLMVEACMTLVERTAALSASSQSTAGLLYETAQKSVASADAINSRLVATLKVLQQQLHDSESATPEEAQVIAIAGYQQLASILQEAERDGQDHSKHMTDLLQAVTTVVTEKSAAVGPSTSSAHQRYFSVDSPAAATKHTPSGDRLDSLRHRLVNGPDSPRTPMMASPSKVQQDREIRRMSSEIMRPSTTLDSYSPLNRFSTQSRGTGVRSPGSSRTSGEYFSAAESNNSRKSPMDGPRESTIYETADEGTPKRSSSIFRRFQRSPLKSVTVPSLHQPPPQAIEDSTRQTPPDKHSHRNRLSGASLSTARGGSFLPQMASGTPTIALSAVTATTELSPVADGDYFGGNAERLPLRASLDDTSLRSEVETEERERKERRASGTAGALRKMSSFIRGGH